MRLSIRMKFLLAMSGLLMVCLSFYMLMSVAVFKNDKEQLVYDINRSQVTTIANEINSKLKSVHDTLSLIAQLPRHLQETMITGLLERNSDVIALLIYEKENLKPLSLHTDKTYFETYGLDSEEFKQQQILTSERQGLLLKEGQQVWNATHKNSPPLWGVGQRVIAVDEYNNPINQWLIVAYIKLDTLVKTVTAHQLSDIRISNSDGQVLLLGDLQELHKHPLVSTWPAFEKLQSTKAKTLVSPIVFNHEKWLMAGTKTFGDKIFVLSQSPENKVFSVVQSLAFRTLLFGTIVLTMVILVAVLLSKSLTHNIALLTDRMLKVSEGDLVTPLSLSGRDETVQLADSFNDMIHDLKQSRDALEVMNRELDQKVKDRTKELEVQNRKVVEAQEALLRTTRLASMGEVAGRAAHEVLNPLTSLLTRANLTLKKINNEVVQPLGLMGEIKQAWQKDYKEGQFDNLLNHWKSPSQIMSGKNLFEEDLYNITEVHETLQKQVDDLKQDLKFVQNEGERISKIVNSMRRLGNTHSEVKVHSLHLLIKDCCFIMADLFEQNRILIVQNLEAAIDTVSVDRDEFIQSLTNMMRNSLQSMTSLATYDKKKTQSLIITTRNHNGRLEIDLEDSGVGVSPEHQGQLFNSYFTTKSSEEGTGLGLSISRRFMRAHQGDIEFVESQPKERTVFRIWLPLIAENQTKAAA